MGGHQGGRRTDGAALDGIPAISVRGLRKTYLVPEREGGLGAAVASLMHRRVRSVTAVDGISFDIAAGEVVGFLGPNGAGKTTTLKMLSGLLHPTGGGAEVQGRTPWRRERPYLRQITLVMGQRNQLNWDLPPIDSFELHRAVYRIPVSEYRATLQELDDLLDLGPLLHRPVRNLSLGERMKCEIAGALLHRPRVLFLDEPTIGLDVVAQRRIRGFLGEYNRRHGATVLLTSHYMADVEALCRRVIVIHHGRLLFDGELSALAGRFLPFKTLVVQPTDPATDLSVYGEVVGRDEEGRVTLRVPKTDTAATTSRILAEIAVEDLSVVDPPVEDVIERVFAAAPPAEWGARDAGAP